MQLAQEWYFNRDGENRGPLSTAEMRTYVSNGTLRKDDLIWKQGMEQWIPAARIKGLFPAEATPPPISLNPSPTISDPTRNRAPAIANTLAEKAHQNASQIIKDVKQKFHLQRIVVLTATALGMGSALLPWVVFDDERLFSLSHDGWILMGLFLPGLVLSISGNRLAPLGQNEKWGLVASAGLGGLIACQRILNPSSAFGPLASIELFSHGLAEKVSAHVGPYATALSSVAICLAAFLLSRPVAAEKVAALIDQDSDRHFG